MITRSSVPVTTIELGFECSELANLDTFSKTDCQIWIFMKTGNNPDFLFIGKTEIIKDNLNPSFTTKIPVNYFFEEVQMMKFVVVDIDHPIETLDGQDFVGEVVIKLSDIVGSRAQRATRKIMKGSKCNGYLNVFSEEVGSAGMNVRMKISGHHLDNKDGFLGKSDPFLEFSKQKDGEWVVFHRTEWLKNTLNPTWKKMNIPTFRFTENDDFNTQVRVDCFDYDNETKKDLIGTTYFTLNELQSNVREYNLINEKKRKKKKYTNSGVLTFDVVEFQKEYTFLDYIIGGTQINLMVAIDYTASNGDPREPASLHYMQPGVLNQYGVVIHTVGSILAGYDSDNMIPTYGFGGKMPDGTVSHCFHVNGNPNNPEVFGVGGVLEAYTNSLTSGLQLYGPTNFSKIINTASEISSQLHAMNQDVQGYLILLILTDGEITDMEETVASIVEASQLPMSIVIVGIGDADFSNMNRLDGDDHQLKANGKKAKRDIVQFVPFNQCANDLAGATLAEIPGQFLDYMKKNKVVPRPPPSQDEMIAYHQQQMASLQ
eukprot:TRINITY_DN351_c0_g2_i1.p1 TRINITY_DN351_c0_g2~~TRINITY_DN351_c0_g2_i1.p1  ORF type:complete len:554 (+),score=123.69 TRINITY_DN351_c0_g2_i1:32-1663(+)